MAGEWQIALAKTSSTTGGVREHYYTFQAALTDHLAVADIETVRDEGASGCDDWISRSQVRPGRQNGGTGQK